MKTELIKQYTENLLNIYTKELLKNCDYDYILVLNNQEESQVINNILYTNYQDFYKHDYLKYSIPPIRKPRKLLTYNDGFNISGWIWRKEWIGSQEEKEQKEER